MWAGVLVKSWARTLHTICLSTGEAELAATVKAAAEAEGVVSILRDFHLDADIQLRSDASAAIGISKRLGLGKVRHLSVADLWIQQVEKRGDVRYGRVPGADNCADMFTKAVDAATLWKHARKVGMRKIDGRAECAPKRRSHEEMHTIKADTVEDTPGDTIDSKHGGSCTKFIEDAQGNQRAHKGLRPSSDGGDGRRMRGIKGTRSHDPEVEQKPEGEHRVTAHSVAD